MAHISSSDINSGHLSRDLKSGSIREEDIFTSDETDLDIPVQRNHTLVTRGETEITYADVVSGEDGMKMMVTLGCGHEVCMNVPLIIFKNPFRPYSNRCLADDLPGVEYRSGSTGFYGLCSIR